jgi:hypothetical protein
MTKVEFSKFDIKTIRIIWGIGLVLVLIFFLVIHLSQKTTGWDLYYKYKSEEIYNGNVVKKYIDKKNRSTPTLILNDQTKVLLISNDWYKHFKIDDYVFKEKGSLIIKLIKNHTHDTLYFDYRDIEIKE